MGIHQHEDLSAHVIFSGKSLRNKMKKRGLKIDPCGTPCFTRPKTVLNFKT